MHPRLIRDLFPFLTALFALAVVALARAAGEWGLAVYALSFWHYVVYALAFFRRRVGLGRLKRDAVLLKTMSLVAFALVLWTAQTGLIALVLMAGGFALNLAAARALGMDRTYYGVELAGLPPERSAAFPYSVIAHPMLAGNMLAFGAPLADGAFRSSWWPLALLHVGLNFLLLAMEVRGGRGRLPGILWLAAGLAASFVLLPVTHPGAWPYAVAIAAIGLGYAAVLFHRYGAAANPQSNGGHGL